MRYFTKTLLKNKSVVIGFVLMATLVILFSVISMAQLYAEYSVKLEELAAVTSQYEDIKTENEELQSMIVSNDIDQYAISVAREDLGYAFPDEKVYKVTD